MFCSEVSEIQIVLEESISSTNLFTVGLVLGPVEFVTLFYLPFPLEI